MGSGCANTVSSKSACTTLTSADCVIYQGDSIPLLGICCGDTISEVEETLINKLLTVLDGTGILLSGVTLDNAAFLKNLLGSKDKTLLNMIQLLVDSDTNLRSLVTSLQAQLTPTGDNYQFNLGCLSNSCCDDLSATRDEIIQMLIDKYCDIETLLNQITETSGNISTTVTSSIGNFLINNINTCSGTGIQKTGTGASAKITLVGMPPPKSAIPYWGPLTYFDSNGKGLDGTPLCGWHILNGLDGYPDWRGYTFAGANNGMTGGSLDARVNATALNLPEALASHGDKRGELYHTISSAEMPAHTHNITDPGHTHPLSKFWHGPINWGNKNSADVLTLGQNSKTTGLDIAQGENQAAKTGITINSTGSNQPHNNIQPTVYGVWISRID